MISQLVTSPKIAQQVEVVLAETVVKKAICRRSVISRKILKTPSAAIAMKVSQRLPRRTTKTDG